MPLSAAAADRSAPDPGVTYAGRLRESFDRAVERRGAIEDTLRFGKLEIALRFAGPAMREALLPPYEHLAVAPQREPDGIVSVFDSASTGIAVPDPPWDLPAAEPGRSPVSRYESGGIAVLGAAATGSQTAIDQEDGEAVFYLPDAGAVPANERATPFREPLHPLLARRRSWMTHAGAAGADGRCALIVGPSGSGKSTLALSCARAGMDIVGDDYVVLESGPDTVAHAMQSTAKMTAKTAELLGVADRFRAADFDRTVEVLEKTEFQVDSIFPGCLRRQLTVAAIIAPRVAGLERPRLTPIPPPAALRSLAPSTLLQVRTHVGPLLPALADLVKSVPCFSLELSTDIAANAAAVGSALEGDGS